MENHKSQLVCLLAFSCVIGFSFTILSCVRISLFEGTKLADTADGEARVPADSVSQDQKIASFILERINLMIREQAKFHPDPKNTYSTRGLPVDNKARVRVIVTTNCDADQTPAIIAERKIKALGGTVRSNHVTSAGPIEMDCWLPYEAVKEIAKLPEVSGIHGIPFGETSNQ
jgi:hypothetical protein